jgi:rhodanese-related sulfurtransferase
MPVPYTSPRCNTRLFKSFSPTAVHKAPRHTTSRAMVSQSDKESFWKDQLLNIEKTFTDVTHSSPADLIQQQQQQEQIVFLDIREKEEQQVSIIPNAITLDQFNQSKQQYKDNNTLIIPYCTIGYRSAITAQQLAIQDGFRTKNLIGGIIAWTQQGLPLDTPINTSYKEKRGGNREEMQSVKKVHVFSQQYVGTQGVGYEAVVTGGKAVLAKTALKMFQCKLPGWLGGNKSNYT